MKRLIIGICFSLMTLLLGCSGADTVVGLWRSQTRSTSPTGHTNNMVESFHVIEFLQDGTLHMTNVMKGPAGKEFSIPVNGSYKVIDSTNMVLEIAPNSTRPADKLAFRVFYFVSRDELRFETFNASREIVAYRRVKK